MKQRSRSSMTRTRPSRFASRATRNASRKVCNALSEASFVLPTAATASPGMTATIGARPCWARCSDTFAATMSSVSVASSTTGNEPAYTIWSGINGPPGAETAADSPSVDSATLGASTARRKASATRDGEPDKAVPASSIAARIEDVRKSIRSRIASFVGPETMMP